MEIKYVLWLQISLTDLDREVEFLFRMPTLFDTYEQAQAAEHDFFIRPALRFSGEVVFEIYKRTSAEKKDDPDGPIDVIRWSEYWKYECRIRKEAALKNLMELFATVAPDEINRLDFPEDDRKVFLPYADQFETIYDKYLTGKTLEEVCDNEVTCTSCLVRPICVKKLE